MVLRDESRELALGSSKRFSIVGIFAAVAMLMATSVACSSSDQKLWSAAPTRRCLLKRPEAKRSTVLPPRPKRGYALQVSHVTHRASADILAVGLDRSPFTNRTRKDAALYFFRSENAAAKEYRIIVKGLGKLRGRESDVHARLQQRRNVLVVWEQRPNRLELGIVHTCLRM